MLLRVEVPKMNSTVLFLQNCNLARNPFAGYPLLYTSATNHRAVSRFSKVSCSSITFENVTDVLHNKVLVAASVSAAIGQLSKPFTSTLFYGKKFDLRTSLQAGGFPSTHSSAAVATATCLAFERGFSDAIFGLAVVYASLIMYDAQGVRREVGTHAKELNKVLSRTTSPSSSPTNDGYPNPFSSESSPELDNVDPVYLEKEDAFPKKPTNSSVVLKSVKRLQISFVRPAVAATNITEGADRAPYGSSPLKESIGHTEIEVTAGALLGLLVSLAICPYI